MKTQSKALASALSLFLIASTAMAAPVVGTMRLNQVLNYGSNELLNRKTFDVVVANMGRDKTVLKAEMELAPNNLLKSPLKVAMRVNGNGTLSIVDPIFTRAIIDPVFAPQAIIDPVFKPNAIVDPIFKPNAIVDPIFKPSLFGTTQQAGVMHIQMKDAQGKLTDLDAGFQFPLQVTPLGFVQKTIDLSLDTAKP